MLCTTFTALGLAVALLIPDVRRMTASEIGYIQLMYNVHCPPELRLQEKCFHICNVAAGL